MTFEDEALAVLEAVDRGDIAVYDEERTSAAGRSIAVYHLPNGWTVEVFNDCDQWDYLEGIEAPDGRKADFDAISGGIDAKPGDEPMPRLYKWRPSPATVLERWGLERI